MSDMSHAAVAADAGRLDRSPASGSSAVDSALSTPDSLLEVASVVSSLSGEAYGKQYSTESSLSFASAVDEFDFSPERVVMATLDSDAPHPSVKRKLGVAGRASEVEVEVAPCAEGEVGALLCNEEQASALRRDRGEASVLRCAEEEVRVLRRDGGEVSAPLCIEEDASAPRRDGGEASMPQHDDGLLRPADADSAKNRSSETLVEELRERHDGMTRSSSYPCETMFYEGNPVGAIVFGAWDNILGPRVVAAWTNTARSPPPDADDLRYVAGRALAGELCRDVAAATSSSRVENKLLALAGRRLVVDAYVFGAAREPSRVSAVALVLPRDERAAFLATHALIADWMQRMVGKMRVLLEVESIMDAVKDFSMYIPDFMEMISSLRLVGLPPKINTCDTLLGAGENIEVQFIAKAIASHMQTFGCTVVIGQNAQTVNEMINTLGIFLLPEERQCSRYVLEDSLWPYHPSLFLQGLLMERQGETNISARDVLCSRYPTTVVDVTTSEVRQSPPLHEHVHRRCDALAQEIHCIWTGKREDELYPTVGVFQPVDYPDTLVQNFLYELFQLSGSNGVRETYIQNFIRLLSRKALALIKYVETHTNFGRDPLKTSMRKLKHDLDLGQEGDFRIVLAQAEKLKPGFFCFLIGNSKLFAEPVYDI